MVTILLINLVGVAIYVSGAGMCLRATRRTGNNGYLLLAAYFAAVLVVSSLDQVRDLERGPDPTAAVEARRPARPASSAPADATAATMAESEAAEEEVPPPEFVDVMPTASLPILPALLLVGVFLVSKDDPRRRCVETEDVPASEATPTTGEGQEPKEHGQV